MSDLALAAAFAAGQQPAAEAYAPQRRAAAPNEPMEEEMGELPTIDDLEVAAAAAGVAPVPPLLAELGYFELGPAPEAMKEDDTSSEEDSSSSEEESSGDDEDEDAGQGRGAGSAVRLELHPAGDDAVSVRLVLLSLEGAGAASDDVEAEVEEDSSYAASSSSSSSSDSGDESGDEVEGEPLDIIENYADLKKMIDDMDAAPAELDDDEEGGGAGAGAGAHRAEAELLGSVPLPSLAALEIGADEAVQAAGSVQSMLEGMVVIKAQSGSRALNEGCVLVLEDRTPIGCVEEIFGPVMSPFYALRYAGAAPMPAALQPGVTVYSVDRLANFVLPEALRVRGYDAAAEEEEEADLEARFSDDEAEAEHRRKLKAKRKEQPDGLPQQGGGRGGRQFSGGGRGGRGGRGGGRGRGRGGQQQQQQHGGQQGQQQQQQAFYHPQQQMVQPVQPMQAAPLPQGGRQFSGGLRRQQQQQQQPGPPPPPAFQAHAAAAQFTGMSLQGGVPGMGGYQGYAPFYGGQPGMQPSQASGQVLRPQYAAPPPPRPGMPGTGVAVMQPQYMAAQPGAVHFVPAPPGGYPPPQQGQAVHGGFRPALQPPPPAYPPPPQLHPPHPQPHQQ